MATGGSKNRDQAGDPTDLGGAEQPPRGSKGPGIPRPSQQRQSNGDTRLS